MAKRTIELTDAEIIYSIGAVIESFRFLDKYRRDWAGKGVNRVTEQAMSERYTAVKTMVESLNHEYPRVDEDFAKLTAELIKSNEEVMWESATPW